MAEPIRIIITGDSSEAQDAVNDADRSLTGFASRVTGGTFAKIGGVIAGVFAADRIKDFGLAGLKVAADFQQTTIAFEGLLGSAQEAQGFLSELRNFAAKTPFEFTGLATASRQLLAVGYSAQDVIPTMTSLGNVAATLGVGEEGIQSTIRALGQMKGKGKASAEELQQISEALPGFSAVAAIAQDMGITTAEAFKLMEKGALPADQAIESILRGMEKFPGAAGAMEKQSLTLNGVISTFKDTVNNAAIDFITPYLPAISAGISKFAGFLTTTAIPALKIFTDSVAGGMRIAIDAFRNGSDEINNSGFSGVMASIGDSVRLVYDAIKSGSFDGFVTALQGAGSEAGGGFATILGNLADGARNFFESLPSLNDVLSVTNTAFKFAAENSDLLAKALPFVIAGFAAYKAAQAAANIAAVLGVPIMVAQTASNFALAAAIRSTGTASLVASTETVAANGVRNTSMLASVGTMAVAVASTVGGWIVMGATALIGAAQMALAWLIALGPIALVIAAVVGVVALVVANWDTVKNATSRAWNAVSGFVSEAWTKVTGAVSSGVGRAVAFVKELPGKILETFTSLPGKLTEAGGNVIQGFIQGLKNKAGDLIQAIKDNITDKLPGFVKKALGIASPSKVFAGYGRNVMEGMALGIRQSANAPVDALDAAVGNLGVTSAFDAQSVARSTAAANGGSNGGGFTYAPTYQIEINAADAADLEARMKRVLEEHDKEAQDRFRKGLSAMSKG